MNTKNLQLIPINLKSDIPKNLYNTPFERLIKFHNFKENGEIFETPELIIATCMDYRINLKLPDRFAFVIRTAGANIQRLEFKISFASSMTGIKHVAIIGHTDCGMVNLSGKEDKVVEGLVKNVGWTREHALEHFNSCKPLFGIEHEANFAYSQCEILDQKYPNLTFVPMVYKVEDNLLYLLAEK